MKTRNTLYIMASRFVGMAISFVTIPYLMDWCGTKSAYGVLLLSFTIAPYVAFVDLGYAIGAQKFMIEALVDGDRELAHRIQRCQVSLCLISAATGFLIYQIVGLFVRFPALPPGQSFAVFSLAGVTFAFTIFTQILTTVCFVYDRIQISAIVAVVRDLATNTILIYLGWRFHSTVALSVGYAIGVAVGFVIFCILLLRKVPDLTLAPMWDWDLIRRICVPGLRNVPNNIIGNLANRSDRMLIGAGSTAALTDYANATKPVEIGFGLLTSVSAVITPDLTRKLKKSRGEAGAAMYRYGLAVFALGVGALLIPSASGDPFLHAWLKAKAPESGGLVMSLMAFYYLCELHSITLGSLFLSTGNVHRQIPFAIQNAVLTIILTIPIYHLYGLVGVGVMNAAIAASQLGPRVYVCYREAVEGFSFGSYLWRAVTILIFGFGGWWLVRAGTAAVPALSRLPKLAMLIGPVAGLLFLVLVFAIGIAPAPIPLQRRLGFPWLPWFDGREEEDSEG